MHRKAAHTTGCRALLGVRVGLVVCARLCGLRVIHLPILIAASASGSVMDHVKHLQVRVVLRRLARLRHTGEQRAGTKLLHPGVRDRTRYDDANSEKSSNVALTSIM